jgi:hypothetical protein
MKTKILMILVVVLAVGGLFAPILYRLKNPPLREGYVVGMWHQEASTSTIFIPITTWNGKFATTTHIPHTVHDDEDWVIKISNLHLKPRTRTLYVSKKMYELITVGSYFSLDDAVDIALSDPDIKIRKEE